MSDQKKDLVITQRIADVFAGNIGMTMSPPQLTGVLTGDTRLKGGCIKRLFYGSNSKDLDIVFFDNDTSVSITQVQNLRDFREGFECAAKFGMGATFCLDPNTREMSMLNLYPCLCKCKNEEGAGKGRPSGDFRELAGS